MISARQEPRPPKLMHYRHLGPRGGPIGRFPTTSVQGEVVSWQPLAILEQSPGFSGVALRLTSGNLRYWLAIFGNLRTPSLVPLATFDDRSNSDNRSRLP